VSISEFPDVVGFYEAWLRAALAGHGYPQVGVSRQFLNQPGEVVWLARDGGPRLDVARDNPRLRVNCLSDTRIDAFTERVRALMFASLGQGPVRRVTELAGPVEIPNPKPWRYLLFDVVTVGSPLTV
jgi:hypothetical protein